jgi:hypothetical protein
MVRERISSHIQSQLPLPKFRVAFWHRRARTSLVLMPEAAVNKYTRFISGQYNVRLTWQLPVMQSKPQPKRMQLLSKREFRTGVLSVYSAHQ